MAEHSIHAALNPSSPWSGPLSRGSWARPSRSTPGSTVKVPFIEIQLIVGNQLAPAKHTTSQLHALARLSLFHATTQYIYPHPCLNSQQVELLCFHGKK